MGGHGYLNPFDNWRVSMETRWTRVKDELPDDGAEVLTTRMSIISGELFVRQEFFHNREEEDE